MVLRNSVSIPEADLHVEGQEDLESALVAFSYSLSMMENIYPVVDRIVSLLSPDGIVGVADFYVSAKRSPTDPTRQVSWFKRWFWSIWFDFDGIYLHPSRREYLEHKFATVKMVSHLNPFITHLVYIPYYVWIGSLKDLSNPSAVSTMETSYEDLGNESDSSVKEYVPVVSNTLFACKHSLHGSGMKWRESYDTNLNITFMFDML